MLHPREPGSVNQGCQQILVFKVGVVRQDLVVRHAGAQHFEDELDRVPQAPDAGLAVTSFAGVQPEVRVLLPTRCSCPRQ